MSIDLGSWQLKHFWKPGGWWRTHWMTVRNFHHILKVPGYFLGPQTRCFSISRGTGWTKAINSPWAWTTLFLSMRKNNQQNFMVKLKYEWRSQSRHDYVWQLHRIKKYGGTAVELLLYSIREPCSILYLNLEVGSVGVGLIGGCAAGRPNWYHVGKALHAIFKYLVGANSAYPFLMFRQIRQERMKEMAILMDKMELSCILEGTKNSSFEKRD